MRIKLVSEGRGATTKVIDADTGVQIPNVTKVTWTVEARGLARCTMELVHVPVDVEGAVTKMSWRSRFKGWVLGRWSAWK